MEKYVEVVVSGHASGMSKDDVCDALMNEGAKYSEIPKILKASGVRFAKIDSGWRGKVVAAFKENQDLSRDELEELLKDSVKNPALYADYYHELFRSLVAIS